MSIEFPYTKDIKDEIRAAIGQPVTFVMVAKGVACPQCAGAGYYDEVNNASLDVFCSVCLGNYWINAENTVSTIAHVRWRSGDDSDYGVAGYSLEGEVTVTIDINSLTEEQVSNIKEIIVDSRKVTPYQTVYRGVPTRDRIRFICKQSEKAE